jgi:hypothetical protein
VGEGEVLDQPEEGFAQLQGEGEERALEWANEVFDLSLGERAKVSAFCVLFLDDCIEFWGVGSDSGAVVGANVCRMGGMPALKPWSMWLGRSWYLSRRLAWRGRQCQLSAWYGVVGLDLLATRAVLGTMGLAAATRAFMVGKVAGAGAASRKLLVRAEDEAIWVDQATRFIVVTVGSGAIPQEIRLAVEGVMVEAAQTDGAGGEGC